MMMSSEGVVRRPPGVGGGDEGMFGACDFTSYCYFTLAVVLFTLGTVVTVFALDNDTATLFSSLGHMWLIGPIFISSGLMVAVKTVLYLRKKNLMTFILRQRAMFRDLHGTHVPLSVARNMSNVTLPPSYDSAVGPMLADECDLDVQMRMPGPGCVRFGEEVPPPSYEEAMVLVRGQGHPGYVMSRPIEDIDNDRQLVKGADA